jgi:hypothetical protein
MSEPTIEKKTIPVTPRIKAQAEALWKTGEFATVRALAGHLGVSPTGLGFLKKDMKGAGISKVKEAVEAAVVSAAAEDAALLQARAKETKEQHYGMAAALAKLTWGEILRAKREELPYSTIAANVKALDIAMTVLKKAREERFAVLGLDSESVNDDGVMPELVVSELSETQVKDLREAQDDDDFLDMPLEAADDEPDPGVVDTTEDDVDGIVEE